LKVILAERHDTPLVSLCMQVKAGFSADEPSKLGATMLMSAVLSGGTKSRDSLQINDELQRLGANLDASSNLDFTMIQLSALTNTELFGRTQVAYNFSRSRRLNLLTVSAFPLPE